MPLNVNVPIMISKETLQFWQAWLKRRRLLGNSVWSWGIVRQKGSSKFPRASENPYILNELDGTKKQLNKLKRIIGAEKRTDL